jgi:hypothetical protein
MTTLRSTSTSHHHRVDGIRRRASRTSREASVACGNLAFSSSVDERSGLAMVTWQAYAGLKATSIEART